MSNKVALITGITGQDGAYLGNMDAKRDSLVKKHDFKVLDFNE